jgi:class 3 adenylate cyclase
MRERNVGAAQIITFRIGINVGDIIVYGDDIFGDG